MKRYRLLKDSPDAKTGDIFQRKTDDAILVDIIYKIDSEGIALAPTYHIEDITNFDEWFEEIDKAGWKPTKGDEYWTIYNNGNIDKSTWNDDCTDKERYKMGNCHRTEEDAEHAKKVQIARTKIRRSSNFKPDWNDADQIKWHVVYDHVNCCLDIRVSYMVSEGAIVYYETREDTRQAIKDLEPEYLLHFGVEKGN